MTLSFKSFALGHCILMAPSTLRVNLTEGKAKAFEKRRDLQRLVSVLALFRKVRRAGISLNRSSLEEMVPVSGPVGSTG